MLRRPMLALLAGITACGGGGRIVALYGDSVGSGSTVAGRIQTPPAAQLARLLGCEVRDYSEPGARVQDALDGVASMPFSRFASHVKADAATTLVIWYGGADAILGTTPENFRDELEALCWAAIAANRRMVLVGTYDIPAYREALAAINAAVHETGRRLSIPVVDVRDIPVTLADHVHPDEVFSASLKE